MTYSAHFQSTDLLIQHLDGVITNIQEPFLESKYAGFLAVNCVAVLEMALRTIFCDFSANKSKAFGNFCEVYFSKINSKIRLRDISKDYLERFGKKYSRRFEKKLDFLERTRMPISTGSSYGNLIEWRHSYSHMGTMPSNASYAEVKMGYESGKEIMRCLFETMQR